MNIQLEELLNQHDMARKLIISLLVLLLLYGFRYISHRIITRQISHVKNRYFWRQTIHYMIVGLGFAILFNIWADWFQSVFTLLTLIAAALTIVSKELILNLLGYIIILSRYMFQVGDRIQIGTYRGDVIEIGPFYISLAELGPETVDEFTGRILKVPNAHVFTQTIANSSKGSPLIWHEIKVELDLFASLPQYLKLVDSLMLELAEPLTEEDHESLKQMNEEIIFVDTKPHRSMKVVKDHVSIKIRFLCKAHKAGHLEDRFWNAFIQANLKDPETYDALIKSSKKDDEAEKTE